MITIALLIILTAVYVEWHNVAMRVRHEAGLAYQVVTRLVRPTQVPWSRLGQRPLILGPRPLEECGDREALVALGVTRVVSLLEAHERDPGWLYTPVADYGSNVTVKWYALADHAPLPTQDMQLYDWAEAIDVAIRTGHLVYLHCRAGVGRSASLAIAYLMLTERLDFQQAHEEVRRWRPQVGLNSAQHHALVLFQEWLDERE